MTMEQCNLQAVNMWNNLPQEVIALTVNCFNGRFDRYSAYNTL